MALFSYKAKKWDGSLVDGSLEAADQNAATDALRGRRLVVLDLKPSTDWTSYLRPAGKVTAKDLTLFSRQLSTLVSAGVPIVQGLATLERQSRNPTFKEVLGAVRRDIEGGMSISESLKRQPEAFPDFYVSMVSAGELGGILDVILERLTIYLENLESLKAKVKTALVYPAVVLGICGGVTVFLMVFVVPTFQTIFASFGAKLPWLTQFLIDAAFFMKTYLPLFIAAGAALWKGALSFYKTVPGRHWVDGRILKLPVFGEVMGSVALSKFARTLGTLIKSGVPILQALETVAATVGNVVVAQAVLAARDSIREGGRLAEPLAKSGLFPEMAISMIAVGEETGSLDLMLAKIADLADQEVDATVKALTSIIEPVVIVLMGLIIGTIVIAMFWPMFDIFKHIE